MQKKHGTIDVNVQIKFSENNNEIVKQIQSVDLNKIFNIVSWKKNDSREKIVQEVINMLNIYAENYKNHEGNFLANVKPFLKNDDDDKNKK